MRPDIIDVRLEVNQRLPEQSRIVQVPEETDISSAVLVAAVPDVLAASVGDELVLPMLELPVRKVEQPDGQFRLASYAQRARVAQLFAV